MFEDSIEYESLIFCVRKQHLIEKCLILNFHISQSALVVVEFKCCMTVKCASHLKSSKIFCQSCNFFQSIIFNFHFFISN